MTCDADQAVSLVYTGVYQPGDRIALEIDHPGQFCVVQFEDTMDPALIYVVSREINFHIPFGEQAITYSPKSFKGSRHLIRARLARPRRAGRPPQPGFQLLRPARGYRLLPPRLGQRRDPGRGGLCRPQRHRRHF